jgi:RNA polymerase sigma-70 factor (ECF subfamily)
MNEDFSLLESFKKGDHRAFERLVAKYKVTVFNTIYSMVRDAHEADDIAQEVFLKIYFSAGSFKYKSSFSTWLYRITVNKCLDSLRKRKNKTISLDSELNEGEFLKIRDVLQSNEKNVEEKMIGKELQETVRKILSSLPKKYCLILTLKEIENLSYKEIAQIMNISINKVKIWLFRARQKLKEKLGPLSF